MHSLTDLLPFFTRDLMPDTPATPRFALHPFQDLSPLALMEIYRLRFQVFILEQTCFYEEIDGVDPYCDHLVMLADKSLAGEALAGYARLVPPGIKFKEASIGRIVVHPDFRGRQWGKLLVAEAKRLCGIRHPNARLRIEAQAHLERFYSDLGFTTASAVFDLDGIPHIEMTGEAVD